MNHLLNISLCAAAVVQLVQAYAIQPSHLETQPLVASRKPPIDAILLAKEAESVSMINLKEAATQCQNYLEMLHQGNPQVREAYTEFGHALYTPYFWGEISGKDMARIIHAVLFAAEKHSHQTRNDPDHTPYIVHPLHVTTHLIKVGQVRDADVLIAALLQDTVEATNTTFEEIHDAFGKKVEEYVRELTDNQSLSQAERKELQVTRAPDKSPGAAMINLADQFDNLRELCSKIILSDEGHPWLQEWIDAYFAWAKRVVDALPYVNPDLKSAIDKLLESR